MRHLSMVCLALVFNAPSVNATELQVDGSVSDCPYRAQSQQEQAAYQSAYNAAKNAMPAIKDWVMSDTTDDGGVHNICLEDTNQPLTYYFKFDYKYDDESITGKLYDTVNAGPKGTPAQQAQLAKLDTKIEKLKEARKLAGRSGNDVEVSRIKEELKAAKREHSNIKDDVSAAHKSQIMDSFSAKNDKEPELKTAGVAIFVNDDDAPINECDKPIHLAGAPLTYLCQHKNSGHLTILLGAWDKASETSFKSKRVKTSVVTKPQIMTIQISAEKQMAENMAQQIKLGLLKAQISGH